MANILGRRGKADQKIHAEKHSKIPSMLSIFKASKNRPITFQTVERFYKHDTLEGWKLMKFHKFNGVNYAVRINFSWKHEVGGYHAICINNIYR